MSRISDALANEPLIWGAYIIRPDDEKHTDVYDAPNEPGIYGWYTKDAELMYVGRSIAVGTRLIQHQRRTAFWGGTPTFYSYRLVPEHLIAKAELAHIDALEPRENVAREAAFGDLYEALRAGVEMVWRDALPVQRASLNRKYSALMEQIAARL